MEDFIRLIDGDPFFVTAEITEAPAFPDEGVSITWEFGELRLDFG
jgi:hypothetical protein